MVFSEEALRLYIQKGGGMPENLFIPSVDLRIGSLEEYNRRQKEKAAQQHTRQKPRPCITVSPESGCEGYDAENW